MKKHILLSVFLLVSTMVSAQLRGVGRSKVVEQAELSYAEPKEYEIADITVSGSKFYDGNSMITISGLRVGDKVKIPGDAITSAVKKLMEQGILEDVEITASKIEGEKIWLNVGLRERPRLYKLAYTGIRKGEIETLNDKVKAYKGKIITETLKKNLVLVIRRHYEEKGYMNISIIPVQKTDSARGNNATLKVDIVKNGKVKIKQIIIEGREELKESLIRRKLKNTKQMRFGRIFSPSKFIPKKFEEDKAKLLEFYNKKGYRDFTVLKDSVYKSGPNTVNVVLKIDEGKKYYFRNIRWEGNYIYPDSILTEVLGLKKGDVYNTEDLDKRLNGKPGEDVSSVYMDNGYLFYNCEPVESAIVGDSIDLTLRINEGKQATINRVIVNGNTKTSDHVVLREIRTLPGQKFSKSLIIRTVRELSTIGYFNPEKITPNPIPKPDGTVDIEYNVEEKPSDQIELSGGWGGYIGFVGTLGVVFNNFSARNIPNLSSWKPLPAGDGQKLAIRFQATGASFQNYSLTFTEPWLGGKKPNSFSISIARNISYPFRYRNAYAGGGFGGGLGGGLGGGFGNPYGGGYGYPYGGGGIPSTPQDSIDVATATAQQEAQQDAHFNSTTVSFSLGKRLKKPDDYFSMSNSLSFQFIDVSKELSASYGYPSGNSTLVTFVTNFARNSIDNPTFPRMGSSFSLTGSLTPPFSLLGLNKSSFIEYHKWMFDASWFTPLAGKLIFHTRAHMGFLGSYGKPITTFERFDLGGSGMVQGYTFNRDIIGLRGYKDRNIGPSGYGNTGGVVYNKFVMEVRYPVSLNPSATIFLLGFAEGGNNWSNYAEYNPFKLYKSAGVGARIFMPAFGMIGIDYGFGFDKPRPGETDFGRQAFTFSIGQQIR